MRLRTAIASLLALASASCHHHQAASASNSDPASLQTAAERGDVEAQVALGKLYLNGQPSLAKDLARARQWFLRAAEARHPGAAYYLGVIAQNGDGAGPDARTALRWWTVAASQGSAHAMFMLANAYRAGAGAPRDDDKALAFYRRAGELDHPAALQTLAMAYLYGELGLAPDEAESRRYAMEAEHAIRNPPVTP
jgi:TPR repeat protein